MIRFLSVFAIIATLTTSQTSNFEVQEATIADIHRALASRRITCPQLVEKYLERIEAYDKKGPAINAIITVNSKVLDEAVSTILKISIHPLTNESHSPAGFVS